MVGDTTGQNGEYFEDAEFGLGGDYTERLRHVNAASKHIIPDPELPNRTDLAAEAERMLEDDTDLEKELVLLRQEARIAAMKAPLEDPDDQTEWSSELHEAVAEYEKLLSEITNVRIAGLPEPFHAGGPLEAAAQAAFKSAAAEVTIEEITPQALADQLRALMDIALLDLLPDEGYRRAMSLVSLAAESEAVCADCAIEGQSTPALQELEVCRSHVRAFLLAHKDHNRYSDQDSA